MSFYPVLCNYVALPDSIIKSPGAILKKVDRQVGPDCKQVQISNLFNQFKDMIGVEFNEHSPSVDLLRPRASSYTFPEPSFNEVLAHPELKPLIKFIKAKSFADEIDSVIRKTQQILGLFGIELVIKITHDHHDELFALLKHIVTGFCFFPESLISKIEIKYVVICDKQDESLLKAKYSEKNSIFCPLDLETLRVHPKVSMEVNKAILSHFLLHKPQIFEDWEHSLPVNSNHPISGVLEDFETTFLLWVKNSNNHMYRTKMDKLKKVLMKHFPTELTEEWSKTQSDEKKKVQSARISSTIGTLIAN